MTALAEPRPFAPARELPNGEPFPDVPHGVRRYDHKKIKCRCEVCREGRREYDRQRYEANAEAVKARVRAHRAANVHAIRARDKERYEREAPVRIARARKRYQEKKPEIALQVASYRQTPRGKAVKRVNYMRRRDVPGTNTAAQIEARVAYFGHRCAYCGGPYEHLDHVKPLSAGGSNWPANLRPSCEDCNLRKGAKPWRQFLLSL